MKLWEFIFIIKVLPPLFRSGLIIWGGGTMKKYLANKKLLIIGLALLEVGCEKDLLSEYSSADATIVFKKDYVATGEGELQGHSVTIPPGTKEADTVTIQEGSLVVDPGIASELEVDLTQSSLQKPIHISGSENVPEERIKRSTLAIMLEPEPSSLVGFGYVVAYDVFVSGSRFVGIATDFVRDEGHLIGGLRGFGNYQVVRFNPQATPPPAKELTREGMPVSEAERNELPQWMVKSLTPIVAIKDQIITVSGENFTKGISIAYRGKSLTPESILGNELKLRIPDVSKGLAPLYFAQNGTVKDLTLGFSGSDGDFPLSLFPPEEICKGKKFYDANGDLKEGTKNCSQSITDINPSVILSGHSIGGVEGQLPLCSSDGQTDCVNQGVFKAASTEGLADKVVEGSTVAGVSGNVKLPDAGQVLASETFGVGGTALTGTVGTCNVDGQVGCVVGSTGGFKAVAVSNLSPGHIKAGVTIGGVSGQYPSATFPLPGASSTADLDNPTFNAKVKSGDSFEYWTSSGSHQTGSGDIDILPGNILSGVSVFGTDGTIPLPQCTATNESACESDSACRWESAACELNPWHIRSGILIAGQTGSIKANCRNRVNGSIYNSDFMPPGISATTAGTNLDWWDTIDHLNGTSSTTLPTGLPTGWTSDHMCGKELWSDMTPDGACDDPGDDCLMKDNVTGLLWSEGFPDSGTGSTDSTMNWSDAIGHCDSLNWGGRSDWRLPTQIELQTAAEHGIRELGFKAGAGSTPRPSGDTLDNNNYFIYNVDKTFWSATTSSTSDNGIFVYISNGRFSFAAKGGFHTFICVASP